MSSNRACARTTLEIPWLLNGTLPAERRRQVREHLISCPACREELARTREMLSMISAAERAESTAAVGNVLRFRTRPAVIGRRSSWVAVAAAIAIAALGTLFVARRADEAPIAGIPTMQAGADVVADDGDLLFRDGFDAGQLSGWKQQL